MKKIIFILIILSLIGCEKIDGCRPDANIKDGYFGFSCKGRF